jgi:hypothetical protein
MCGWVTTGELNALYDLYDIIMQFIIEAVCNCGTIFLTFTFVKYLLDSEFGL